MNWMFLYNYKGFNTMTDTAVYLVFRHRKGLKKKFKSNFILLFLQNI